jgi:hypothetical protein
MAEGAVLIPTSVETTCGDERNAQARQLNARWFGRATLCGAAN